MSVLRAGKKAPGGLLVGYGSQSAVYYPGYQLAFVSWEEVRALEGKTAPK